MNQSETIGELAAALARVQAEIQPAAENSNNPFFKSQYADLGSVTKAARSLMAENGLSIAQFPGETLLGEHGAAVELTTILMHDSGEWISQSLTMPITKLDPQAFGSAITYARRYALAAVVGVVTGEDDDGNYSSGRNGNSAKSAKSAKSATDAQPEPLAKKEAPAKLMSAGHFRAWIAKEYDYKLDSGGDDSTHVFNTMKLFGIDKTPQDKEERRKIAEALAAYRAMRNKGEMEQDEIVEYVKAQFFEAAS